MFVSFGHWRLLDTDCLFFQTTKVLFVIWRCIFLSPDVPNGLLSCSFKSEQISQVFPHHSFRYFIKPTSCQPHEIVQLDQGCYHTSESWIIFIGKITTCNFLTYINSVRQWHDHARLAESIYSHFSDQYFVICSNWLLVLHFIFIKLQVFCMLKWTH